MKKQLTAISVPTLPEGDYPDPRLPGLSLRVGKKRKTWTLRYRVGEKWRRDTLGYYLGLNPPEGSDHMGLADAREAARNRLDRVEAGVPAEEKAAHPKQAGMTLEQLFDKYEKARMKKAGKGMKTLPEAMRAVRRILADYLKLPAKDFSKGDLRKVRDEVAKTAPQMSDRFMSYLGTIMKWAAQEDHIPMNFVPDTLRVGPGLVKRKRVLTPDEMRAIWAACPLMKSDEGKAYGRLVRFLLVIAQRISEAAALKHGDIIGGRWKQGEEDNKSGREHLLRLPQLALDQLGTGKADQFCFPGKNGKLGGFSKFKEELDELSGVQGWRHHDLRRTASTNMQELSIEPHIIDMVLNHAIKGVGGHYMHAKLTEAKGEALEKWAVDLAKILGGQTRNVV
ncbi:tyrosine-type recombinase/integrase [Rhizobium sp. Nf11,1]|uniref:tyrosine-type recombinase/integrase n=1 Tax=Rhizobium sp. Nf11,1 TaxID=3404923 RepID=UPI003D329F56